MIYVNPVKGFTGDAGDLVKVQIDNSLRLGWKKEDILLVTNFDFKHNGVKAVLIEDNVFCPFRPLSTKTVTVAYLLDKDMIEKDIVYWVHDLDAYQLAELNVDLEMKDVGFTDYGWAKKWSLGSYFFKESSKDMFQWIKDTIYEYKAEDERALVRLTKKNFNNINDRYKKLNITYNLGMRWVEENYKRADKPLKVVHFHPYARGNNMRVFMHGENNLHIPLISKELSEIFKKYGIK